MPFLRSICHSVRHSFDFKGRASRAEFGWFAVGLILYFMLSVLLGGAVLTVLQASVEPERAASSFAKFILLLILPTVASVGSRRCRDADFSGWWTVVLLTPGVAPFVMILWFLMPGSEGANRFGPPPGN